MGRLKSRNDAKPGLIVVEKTGLAKTLPINHLCEIDVRLLAFVHRIVELFLLHSCCTQVLNRIIHLDFLRDIFHSLSLLR